MKPVSKLRVRIISGLIIIFAAILVGRLYFLQVVLKDELTAKAEAQYVEPDANYFNRGLIYFQYKDGKKIPVADIKAGHTISLNTQTLVDIDSSYAALSSVIPIDYKSYFEKASKINDPYELILKRADSDIVKKLSDLKIAGIETSKENWRFYPGSPMASNVIGFVGYKGDNLTGIYGLEKYYNDVLERTNDSAYVNFFAKIFGDIKESLKDNGKREGDLIATIEPAVQSNLEKDIENINKKWSSKSSGGIIINPQNGEIYAMASYPTFDLNNFQVEKNSSVFSNAMVENTFEMGSIMKALTMAAGLDSGTVKADSTYYDAGFLVLNNSRIQNFDGKGRGVVNMQKVLNDSLNTGVAHVAMKMGGNLFSKYMFEFGLDKKSGIDLPNESANLVQNLRNPKDIELATASYGQGVAVTPVAMVRALSALGNGGKLIKPHIVKQIDYRLGMPKYFDAGEQTQVISKETSEEISRMLVNVVDQALLHGKAKKEHYSVAAKTGTALLLKEGGGGYYDNRFLHTFFGYFPAYNPRFLVFLYTKDPQGVQYASETLTTTFMDISDFLINYYEVAPDR